MEKEVATHFSILAWRVPGAGPAIYGVAQSESDMTEAT